MPSVELFKCSAKLWQPTIRTPASLPQTLTSISRVKSALHVGDGGADAHGFLNARSAGPITAVAVRARAQLCRPITVPTRAVASPSQRDYQRLPPIRWSRHVRTVAHKLVIGSEAVCRQRIRATSLGPGGADGRRTTIVPCYSSDVCVGDHGPKPSAAITAM